MDKIHVVRLGVCYACPEYNKTLKTCTVCMCFMPLKTRVKWAKCPKGRWS